MADEWNEKIHCPNCGRLGIASLSEDDNDALTVQSVPGGFKVIQTQYGPAFYCADCDVEVDP
jgi:predicted RNA-binding Zn-ribbon protein involved in translation (DUF1610 family)